MLRLLQVQLRWHLHGWCPLQSVLPSGTLRGPTKHPLGICSNQLRGQRFCRWVSSNGRVSHPKFERAQVLQRCVAWVSPLSLGLSPWRSTTVSSATTSCGVRSPARLDVRQSHMLFLQPDCDTVVAPVADFRSAGSMWRSTASRAALPLRAANPSARPAGERPVLASHDVVSYVWNFHLEFANVMWSSRRREQYMPK